MQHRQLARHGIPLPRSNAASKCTWKEKKTTQRAPATVAMVVVMYNRMVIVYGRGKSPGAETNFAPFFTVSF